MQDPVLLYFSKTGFLFESKAIQPCLTEVTANADVGRQKMVAIAVITAMNKKTKRAFIRKYIWDDMLHPFISQFMKRIKD